MHKITFFIDILTLFDETYAGIANVNYQLAKYFYHNHQRNTYFFHNDKIVKKEIISALIQEKTGKRLRLLSESGGIYETTLEAILKQIHTKTVGIFQHVKSLRNVFGYEVQMMYDLTALLTPEFHYQETLNWHVPRIEKDLESNNLCICISHSTQEDLVNYLAFPEDKTMVSYLGCQHNLREAEPYNKILREIGNGVEKFILVLGTLEPRKNTDMVFLLLENNPQLLDEYKFIFLGRDAGKDKWGDTFKNRLSKVKIDKDLKNNRIKHYHYVSEEEKNILLMTAEFMIYPSFYEGFGLPVLEALSVGCPVLGSVSSSIPEVGEDSVYYFDPCNLKSFEDTFYRLRDDLKFEKERIVDQCIKQSSKFTWEEFINRILGRIENDLNNYHSIKYETKSIFSEVDRKFQILLIKLDHRGDFVLSIPAIMKLRDRFREADIDIIVGEWNASMANHLNVFRNIFIYNFYSTKSSLSPEEKEDEERELLKKLPHYDIAVDLRRPFETRFLLTKVSASLKVGYKSFSDYDKKIDVCLGSDQDEKGIIKENNRLSVSLQLLKLIDAIPINVLNLPKFIKYQPTGKQIAIFPGAGVDSREWPLEYFVQIAKEVLARGWANTVNVYLSSFEKKLAASFTNIQGVNISIGLEFGQILENLVKNRLVIANNSFAPHLSSYLGIPTIAIYSGVETIWEWGPPFGSVTMVYSDVPCLPCHDIAKNCPFDLRCLKQITPDYILKIIERWLERGAHLSQAQSYAYSNYDIKPEILNETIQGVKGRFFNNSETSQCRERLKQFCVGYGIDIGYGGDPILPSAIKIDMPSPYAKCGNEPLNLGGDARHLYWFTDECLDYAFSSHLLEDFPPDETTDILCEWLRVLKVGGNLILYLPDEQKYREHCSKSGQPYNTAHKVQDFSLKYLKGILNGINNIDIIHETPCIDNYSFEIVIKKMGRLTR